MPSTPLTAILVARVTRPGRYFDCRGDGLCLVVSDTGAKRWKQRLTIDGRRRTLSLGRYPDVNLDTARERASEHRALRDAGHDPLQHRRMTVPVPTFAEAAEAAIAHPHSGLTAQTAAHWHRSLARHVHPRLGQVPVTHIETLHVVHVLEAVRMRAPGSVDRVRQRIARVMSWAEAHGFCSHNPCDPALAALLHRRRSPRRPHAALPYAEVPGAVASVRGAPHWIGTRLLLEFVVLTAVRPGEACGACWSEVDLDGATWTVPVERSRAWHPHRVPLSSAALALLREARGDATLCEARSRGGRSDLVFPTPRGRVVSSSALSAMLKQLRIGAVPFGFRHAFRAWAEDTGLETRILRTCLSHYVRPRSANRINDFYRCRTAVMEQWGRHVAPGPLLAAGDGVAGAPLGLDSELTHLPELTMPGGG